MKRLSDDDEAIETIWDKFETQRFEHPDADKPDFVLFDPVEYGKEVARKAEDERDKEWVEWLEQNSEPDIISKQSVRIISEKDFQELKKEVNQ